MAGAFMRWRSGGAAAEARRQRALAEPGRRALEGVESRELLEHATATLARVLDVPFGALYQAHRPDVVLLDLHMPTLDGWQAARRIRELEGGREVPILALSVDASPLAETNAVRAGFKEFIAKPISDYSGLKARIAYWLAQRAHGSAAAGPCERCTGAPRDASAA